MFRFIELSRSDRAPLALAPEAAQWASHGFRHHPLPLWPDEFLRNSRYPVSRVPRRCEDLARFEKSLPPIPSRSGRHSGPVRETESLLPLDGNAALQQQSRECVRNAPRSAAPKSDSERCLSKRLRSRLSRWSRFRLFPSRDLLAMQRPRAIVEAATVICSTDNRASEVAAAQSHSASAENRRANFHPCKCRPRFVRTHHRISRIPLAAALSLFAVVINKVRVPGKVVLEIIRIRRTVLGNPFEITDGVVEMSFGVGPLNAY